MKNTTRTLNVITTFNIRGNEYFIVTAEHFNGDTANKFKYAGIKKEYVTDGKTNRQLNGLQMYVSETIAEVIDRITDTEEVNYLVKTEGLDAVEATRKYFMQKYNLV